MQSATAEISNADKYAFYYDHPIEFCEDIIGVTLEPEQRKVLAVIAKRNRIAVKSGHGPGKTALLAFICIWFLCTRAYSEIPMTAPTQHQLVDVLMPEIRLWLRHSGLDSIMDIDKRVISVKGHDKWWAVAQSCSVPENMQGFHAKNILFLIDEASGVPDDIMQVIEGALTTEGAKIVMVGNPTKISGTFYDAFQDGAGLYELFTFSSEDSARVSKDFIKMMERFGTDSNPYRIRVKGQFPKSEEDTFIDIGAVEDAIRREIVERYGVISIGVDPARFGNDSSVICWRTGLTVHPMLSFHGQDTTRMAGEVVKLVREIRATGYDIGVTIPVYVDETGVGGGVIDQLENNSAKAELNYKVYPVINNGAPIDAQYKDYGTEMWGNVKDLLATISLPDDSEMVAQLTTRKYTVEPNGQTKLERKKDMKKRKRPSPDKADALSLCLSDTIRRKPMPADDKPHKNGPVFGGIRGKVL